MTETLAMYEALFCPLCKARMPATLEEDEHVHYTHPATDECPIRTTIVHTDTLMGCVVTHMTKMGAWA